MSRSKSQKKRRLVARNQTRQLKAQQVRDFVEYYQNDMNTLEQCTAFDTIRRDKESHIAQRQNLHKKRVHYKRLTNDTLVTKVTRSDIPIARIVTSSRLDSKKSRAAYTLRAQIKYGMSELGMSEAECITEFYNAYPLAKKLLVDSKI